MCERLWHGPTQMARKLKAYAEAFMLNAIGAILSKTLGGVKNKTVYEEARQQVKKNAIEQTWLHSDIHLLNADF